MNRLILTGLIVVGLALGAQAQTNTKASTAKPTTVQKANETKMMHPAMPMPAMAGAECKALETFFPKNVSWTGTIPAGAMGIESAQTTSKGSAQCQPLYDGLWYSCDIQETMGTAAEAPTWKGHMLVGYDKAQKAYRATCVDNFGTLMPYHGTLTGNKLVLESPEEMNLMGQKAMERLSFDKSDGTYKLIREQKIDGGTWKVLETAVIQTTSQQALR